MIQHEERIFDAQLDTMKAAVSRQSAVLAHSNSAVFRTVADNIPNGAVFVFAVGSEGDDTTYRFVMASGPALAWAGFSGSAMVGRRLRDILPADQYAAIVPYYHAAARGRSKIGVLESTNGHRYLTQSGPIRDHRFANLGYVISIDIDQMMETVGELMTL